MITECCSNPRSITWRNLRLHNIVNSKISWSPCGIISKTLSLFSMETPAHSPMKAARFASTMLRNSKASKTKHEISSYKYGELYTSLTHDVFNDFHNSRSQKCKLGPIFHSQKRIVMHAVGNITFFERLWTSSIRSMWLSCPLDIIGRWLKYCM